MEEVKEEVKEETKEEVKEETPSKKEDKKEKKDKFRKELEEKDEKIKEANEKLEAFKDKYYRAIAEMDNLRKQYEKDYQNALKYQSQDLAEKLLPSFEMMAMVIGSSANLPPEVSAYVQGFDMVYRQMVQALESEGISEIVTKVGDKFDHTIHAAMETEVVEDEKLVDTVTKIVRKGYKIHDRLIRPTTVIVGKLKEEVKEEVKEDKKEEKENTSENA